MRAEPWKDASFRARDSPPCTGPIQSKNSVNLLMGSVVMTEVARQRGGQSAGGGGGSGEEPEQRSWSHLAREARAKDATVTTLGRRRVMGTGQCQPRP